MTDKNHKLPENLQSQPGHLFINSSAARRGYSRVAAMLNQWRREEQRARADKTGVDDG